MEHNTSVVCPHCKGSVALRMTQHEGDTRPYIWVIPDVKLSEPAVALVEAAWNMVNRRPEMKIYLIKQVRIWATDGILPLEFTDLKAAKEAVESVIYRM